MSDPTLAEMIEAIRDNDISDDEMYRAIRHALTEHAKLKKKVGEWGEKARFSIEHTSFCDDEPTIIEILLKEIRDFGKEGENENPK